MLNGRAMRVYDYVGDSQYAVEGRHASYYTWTLGSNLTLTMNFRYVACLVEVLHIRGRSNIEIMTFQCNKGSSIGIRLSGKTWF